MNETNQDSAATASKRGPRQLKVGTVVSNSMDKTVVVTVEGTVMHRLYHRYVKRTTRFHAHDEQNGCRGGDRVEIGSTGPLSKTKRWRVRQVLEKAQEQ